MLLMVLHYFYFQSKFFPNVDDPGPINKETVSLSLYGVQYAENQLQKVFIAIVDEGACIALTSVRIYYKVCPQIINHLAQFPETKAGPSDTSLITVSKLR